jgi:hypothetical protein
MLKGRRPPAGSGAIQKRGMPSSRWLPPASQFNEARSLCQSRHAVKTAVITTAVPKAPNNATVIAIIATKVSVIKVHPDRVCAQTHPLGLRP